MDIRRMPPGLGEHSVDLLAEAGYRPEEIKALLDSGVTLDGRPDTKRDAAE